MPLSLKWARTQLRSRVRPRQVGLLHEAPMAANLTISIAALALLLSTECQNAFDFDSDGNIHVAISTRGSSLNGPIWWPRRLCRTTR